MQAHLSATFSLTYTYLKALKANSTCNKARKFFKFNVRLRVKDNCSHKYKFSGDVYLCRWFDCRSRIGLQFCLQELPKEPSTPSQHIYSHNSKDIPKWRLYVGGFKLHTASKDGRIREHVINQRNKRQGK